MKEGEREGREEERKEKKNRLSIFYLKCWDNRDFFFVVLGFELRVYTLSHSTSPFLFCDGFFEIGRGAICLGLISAVAKITGISLQCQATLFFFSSSFFCFYWDWGLNSRLHPHVQSRCSTT
jgi:hypothetical protein